MERNVPYAMVVNIANAMVAHPVIDSLSYVADADIDVINILDDYTRVQKK